LLSPDDDEAGEPIPFGEEPVGHEVFTLRDHLELRIVNELDLLIHAVLIALADNGDDEIHEDDVADNQNEEPEEPCEDLEVSSALYDGRGVIVTDGLAQYNHEICSIFDSYVIISRFLDNDLGHDGETSNHKKEEKEKDKELLENYDQHSY
jgi:hypothetical protein